MPTFEHEQRLQAVLRVVRACGATSVLDLGCGDGALLRHLVAEPALVRIVGIDADARAVAAARAAFAAAGPLDDRRLSVWTGSFTQPDPRLCGFDLATLVETIEHIPPERLSAVEQTIFGQWRPRQVVMTTPNADFNILHGVPAHRLRHPDHRFEWSRAQFRRWCSALAARRDYAVQFPEIGIAHPVYGSSSQMAVFRAGPGAVPAQQIHEK